MIPAADVSDLRARVAELEAENARLAAEVARAIPRATKAGKSRLRGAGEAEEASPYQVCGGRRAEYRARFPDVAAAEDRFFAWGCLWDWHPGYQADRRAYMKALHGTTVEREVRKQLHATIRVTMVPNAK